MSGDFWLGLLLSVPLSIAANVVSPAVQRWVERFSQTRAQARQDKIEEEERRAKEFVADRGRFREYLLFTMIKLYLTGALISLFAGLFFVAPTLFQAIQPQLSRDIPYHLAALIRGVLLATGQAASVIGSIVILNLCKAAVSMYYKVKKLAGELGDLPR